MKTAREKNQEEQYRIAKEYLDMYAGVLESADINHVGEIRSQIRAVEDAIRLIEEAEQHYRRSSPRTRTLMSPAMDAQIAVKDQLVEQREMYQRDLQNAEQASEGALEIILNSPNGTTDVILPVTKETIAFENSLAHKLYTFVHDFCDEYEGAALSEKTFEGYVVLSLHARLDRTTFARQLLDAAPVEFGGARTGSVVYVRIAPNFCFTYTQSAQQNQTPQRRIVERRRLISPVLSTEETPVVLPQGSVLDTITKEAAIAEFECGRFARDIHKDYPGTPTMTIAGWQSAWRKGSYKK